MSIKVIIVLSLVIVPSSFLNASDDFFPPAEYIYSKLQQDDIVFLGTTHRKPEILSFIAELIPNLKEIGVTHVGGEIPSDQQGKLDTFMKTEEGLDDVQFHIQVDHPDYRNLYHVLQTNGGPPPVAIDLPYSKHGGDISRDEWMARTILEVFDENPSAKMLVIVGGLHTLKKLEWEPHVPTKNKSIREYIATEKPDIKMWSVGLLIHGNRDECDFTKRFSSLPDAVALDLDDRYRGWKLGMTATLAIIPAECYELVDGVIVY